MLIRIALTILFLTAATADAQPMREWTNHTDVNDVNAITSLGDSLWLATNGGLVRILQSDPSNEVRLTNADGLGDNQLRFVTIDSDGTLWCGGENGRLSRRRHDRSWTVYPFEDENGLPIRLNAAAPGPDGFLWVASDKGVHKFDTRRNGGEIKESYTRIGLWADESRVNDIAVDGAVLAAGSAGVAGASTKNDFLGDRAQWSSWLFNAPINAISNLSYEGVECCLIVGGVDGLYIQAISPPPGPHTSWVPLRHQPLGTPVNDISGCNDSMWTQWVAYETGYGMFNRATGPTVVQQIPGAAPAGFTSVHCTDQAVYFGQTDGGVWRLKDGAWTHIELNGPLDNNYSDIAVDERGRVWATHQNRGADILDDGEWTVLPYILAGPSAPISAVDVAPDGMIWYGLFGGGVWRVDPTDPLNPALQTRYNKTNSSLMWVQNPSDSIAFNYVVVEDVVVDGNGRAWAANGFADSGAVIAWYENGCWGRFDASDGLTSNRPIVLYPLDSSILVGFANVGLIEINYVPPLCNNGVPINQTPRLSHRTTAEGLPSDQVRALLYDHNDTLWIGTSVGLVRYSRDRRRFIEVDLPPEAGLTINTLTADANNSIWIGTALGLVILDADGATTYYNSRNSGLVGDHVTQVVTDPATGEMWIATQSGLSRTDGPLPRAGAVDEVVSYPSPFVVSRSGSRLRFNAPAESHIIITTLDGQKVTEFLADVGWDGRNDSGDLVASGVYFFLVLSDDNEFGRGKIAVIRRE